MIKDFSTKKWGEDVFSLLSWFDQSVVENARIMVVGAGALGNEVIKNLALFGVGKIVIVDYDLIEYSNLCRSVLFREEDVQKNEPKAMIAAQRAREINPNVKVMPIIGDVKSDVGLGVFREMDVIIGCLDSRFARFLVNQHAFRADKLWVDGSIENLSGTARVFKREENCYECGLSDMEKRIIELKMGCPEISKINQQFGRVATTPVSASIIGAIQVQEALKIIHNLHNNDPENLSRNLIGKLFSYEGMSLTVNNFIMKNFDDYECTAADVWEPLETIADLTADTRIEDALALIREHTGAEDITIRLFNNLFIEYIWQEGDNEKKIEVLMPESKLSNYLADNFNDFDLSKPVRQKFIENIDNHFPYKHFTLHQVGFPYYDVLQVSTSKGLKFILLGKDKTYLNFR